MLDPESKNEKLRRTKLSSAGLVYKSVHSSSNVTVDAPLEGTHPCFSI
ncbi:MAG: hypothetical protein ACK5V0_13160, partial [Alphaproteobacteria bacterium]